MILFDGRIGVNRGYHGTRQKKAEQQRIVKKQQGEGTLSLSKIRGRGRNFGNYAKRLSAKSKGKGRVFFENLIPKRGEKVNRLITTREGVSS